MHWRSWGKFGDRDGGREGEGRGERFGNKNVIKVKKMTTAAL